MAQELVVRVRKHLDRVIQNPETRLDGKLLEQMRGDSLLIQGNERMHIVNQVSALLLNIQQDPEPATLLAGSLISSFTFADVQAIDPPVDMLAGLTAPSPPVQLLSLQLIGLAAAKASDASIIAGNLELVRALVDVWLRTTDIAIASCACETITSLLKVDVGTESMPGLMQRRLFKDKNVYKLFYVLASLQTVGEEGQPPKKDKTIAQGRLFDFIASVWHLDSVWQSQIPEVEREFGMHDGEGMVHFVALHMVDPDDILLRRNRIEFFTGLVNSTEDRAWAARRREYGPELPTKEISAERLRDFLEGSRIHSDLLSLYAEPDKHDPVDAAFLHSAAARYVSQYAMHYRIHLSKDEQAKSSIFVRLSTSFNETQPSQWARNDGPKDDLNVLVSLPFPIIAGQASCVSLLPTRPPSADVFRSLAIMFSGMSPITKDSEVMTFPLTTNDPDPQILHADAWASRQLYLRFTAAQPRFWANLVAASSIVALKDTAVAAVDLMTTIISSRWQVQPPTSLDVPEPITSVAEDADMPATGLAAVLHPSVLDHVVPFLMKGSSEGRGSGLLGSDTSAANYHVAEAKLRTTRALKQGIEQLVRDMGSNEDQALLTELAAGLGILLRQGLGHQDVEPGTEIGTMEL